MLRFFAIAVLAIFAGQGHAEIQKYKIDPVHTSIVFKIGHLGFSHVYGFLPDVEGQFQLDDAKPAANQIEFKVKTDGITTFFKKRDDHLKGPDFFNAKVNPYISFKSTSVKVQNSVYEVTGNLTLNGVTKPVTFALKRGRTGEGPDQKIHTGASGQFVLKRSDFNMKYMQGENMLSDEVEIMIGVEGIRE